MRQAVSVADRSVGESLRFRTQLRYASARISRQRRALRQLNRAYDRLRDSNSVLRHMLEVSEATKQKPDLAITLPKDVQPWQKVAFEAMMRKSEDGAWLMSNPSLKHTQGKGRDYSKPMNHHHEVRGMSVSAAWLDEATNLLDDRPWYRRAWDWLVFHTSRAVHPDEVD